MEFSYGQRSADHFNGRTRGLRSIDAGGLPFRRGGTDAGALGTPPLLIPGEIESPGIVVDDAAIAKARSLTVGDRYGARVHVLQQADYDTLQTMIHDIDMSPFTPVSPAMVGAIQEVAKRNPHNVYDANLLVLGREAYPTPGIIRIGISLNVVGMEARTAAISVVHVHTVHVHTFLSRSDQIDTFSRQAFMIAIDAARIVGPGEILVDGGEGIEPVNGSRLWILVVPPHYHATSVSDGHAFDDGRTSVTPPRDQPR